MRKQQLAKETKVLILQAQDLLNSVEDGVPTTDQVSDIEHVLDAAVANARATKRGLDAVFLDLNKKLPLESQRTGLKGVAGAAARPTKSKSTSASKTKRKRKERTDARPLDSRRLRTASLSENVSVLVSALRDRPETFENELRELVPSVQPDASQDVIMLREQLVKQERRIAQLEEALGKLDKFLKDSDVSLKQTAANDANLKQAKAWLAEYLYTNTKNWTDGKHIKTFLFLERLAREKRTAASFRSGAFASCDVLTREQLEAIPGESLYQAVQQTVKTARGKVTDQVRQALAEVIGPDRQLKSPCLATTAPRDPAKKAEWEQKKREWELSVRDLDLPSLEDLSKKAELQVWLMKATYLVFQDQAGLVPMVYVGSIYDKWREGFGMQMQSRAKSAWTQLCDKKTEIVDQLLGEHGLEVGDKTLHTEDDLTQHYANIFQRMHEDNQGDNSAADDADDDHDEDSAMGDAARGAALSLDPSDEEEVE